MNDLISLLAQIRDHYLEGYLAMLESFKAQYSPSAAEVMFEISRDCEYPFRLYRLDMATNAGGSPIMQEFNSSVHLDFEPFVVEVLPNLEVFLHPIAWNGVDIRIGATSSWDALQEWALRWLDPEDHKSPNSNGLQCVIHSVTEPETKDEFSTFSVDFGSAPLEAFEELLHLLRSLGATRVEIKSSSLE